MPKKTPETQDNNKNQKFERAYAKRNIFVRFFGALTYQLMVFLLFFYNKVYLGLKVVGRKNLKAARKQKRGVVSVSNHIHTMDCSMMSTVLMPSNVIFTTIEQNFNIPVARWFLVGAGAVPIHMTISGIRHFTEFTSDKLQHKRVVHFYPEGNLTKYEEDMADFKRGAFYAAATASAPVVPVVFVMRKSRGLYKLIRRGKPCFTAHVLPALEPDTTLSRNAATQDLTERTQTLMRETFAKYNDYDSLIKYKLKMAEKLAKSGGADTNPESEAASTTADDLSSRASSEVSGTSEGEKEA